MSSVKNTFIGSTLLVTGCCVGAGMLALPLSILSFGFIPSLIPLIFAWIYMNFSGVLLVELYSGINQDVNLMGLMEKTLGKASKVICFFLFAFLFYSVLSAYINASSIIIHDFLAGLRVVLPFWLVSVVNCSLLFFGILYGTGEVDIINRIFVFGMFLAYICLIGMGLYNMSFENLSTMQWSKQVIFSMPIFVVSFGYQNLIPTLSNYLNRDKKKIILSFVLGTAIALIIYIFWNFIILGLVSNKMNVEGLHPEFLTRLFAQSPGLILFLVNIFSLFAIVTSLLTISASFVDFLADSSENKIHRPFFAACVLIPPLIISLVNPNIFLFALTYGAGFSAIFLFGVLPVLALWKVRYFDLGEDKHLMPGGRGVLSLYLLVSLLIVLFKVVE